MRIKVLHIMTRLPVGGVENQLLHVIGAYDKDRYKPLVCSLSDKGDIGREIEAEGIEVMALGRLGHGLDLSIAQDIRRIISDRGVMVVRTHQYHANLYGRLGAHWAKAPCIVASVHNMYTRDRKPHRRIINHWLSRWTDMIVAVSDPVRDDILKYDRVSRDKVTVIENGVDTERFGSGRRAEARAGLGIGPDEMVIGCVARLAPQKDIVRVIEAAGIINGKLPIKALIVGDGPEREVLGQRAREVGLAGSVIFTGLRRDIPDMYAAMDAVLMPSLHEGMPNALIEAMAAGKPVIVSDIAPFRAIVEHARTGLVVPVGDAQALAKAALDLLGATGRMEALGRAARQKAIGRHSIGATVGAYCALYERILASKGIS